MKIPVECIETRQDSNIVVSDKGSKNNRSKFRLKIIGNASVQVITVDGCAIKEGVRCDYLLIPLKGKKLPIKELYIELKGTDIKHAVEQIARSIELLTTGREVEKLCFVAVNRSPLTSPEIQKLKKRLKRKHNAKLTVKSGEIVYSHCS